MLDDQVLFDHMVPAMYTQEPMDIFGFWGWMRNPDRLPHSKTVTFFNRGAGRSTHDGDIAPVPEGVYSELLIHLDYYEDWTLQLDDLHSSVGAGSSPSSTSDDCP